jgi:hypothetical protein
MTVECAALGWITGETKSGQTWIAILEADKAGSLSAMIEKKQGVYLAH